MIHTHSIISGYIVLQGNFAFHIPMLIVMWMVTIPSTKERENAFYRENDLTLVTKWFEVTHCFVLAGLMHVVLSLINMFSFLTPIPDAYPSFYKSA